MCIRDSPRPELKEWRQLEMFIRVIALERAIEQRHHLGRLLEQRLVEEMKPARHFVLHRGLLQMKLAGHPHELDLIANVGKDCLPLALRPPACLELAQQEIDLAVLLQHRDALGLRRVGGDDGADAQSAQTVSYTHLTLPTIL